MTETDWLTSADPRAMMRWLAGPSTPTRIQVGYAGFGLTSDRKLRLFARACQERSGRAYPGHLGTSPEDVAAWCREKHALLPASEKAALLRCVIGNPWRPVELPGPPCPDCEPGEPDENCDDCGGDGTVDGPCPWITPTVIAVARAICQERRPADLPILADALEDAGCEAEVDEPSPGWYRCRGCGEQWKPIHKHDDCDGGAAACEGLAEPLEFRRVPNPLLAHLRQVDGPCPACNGKGYQFHLARPKLHEACPACRGTGRVPAAHAIPGCHVVDLILGKE